MKFEDEISAICLSALKTIGAGDLHFEPMRRLAPVNPRKPYVVGRTSLKTKMITIDILTPVKRSPKKISGILRILCHEAAHHQKMPYRQRYKGRWIIRQHYPGFYRQVSRNIKKLKKDKKLKSYFN